MGMWNTLQQNSVVYYNKNPCAWLLWHWFSWGQLARCKGRVGSKFNWQSEDQCQRNHSKWVFVFIPYLKSKYSHSILSKLSRKSALCPRRSLCTFLVRSLRSAQLNTAWLVKCDLLWPDCLNWWVSPWVPAFVIQIFLTPWNSGTHGQVWGKYHFINNMSEWLWCCVFPKQCLQQWPVCQPRSNKNGQGCLVCQW